MCLGRRSKGSVSVFFALSFVSIASLFLCMAECVRIKAFYNSTYLSSAEAKAYLESMYVKKLWEDYRILGIDSCMGTDEKKLESLQVRICDWLMQDTKKGVDYLRIYPNEIKMNEIGYITDDGGTAFVRMAAKAEKGEALIKGTEYLLDKLKEETTKGAKTDDFDEKMELGEKALEKSKEKVDEKDVDEKEAKKYPKEDWEGIESPIKLAKEFRKQKDMSFWLDNKKVSEGKIDSKGLYSSREKGRNKGRVGVIDRTLFVEYALDKFGCFTKESKGNLKYGVEYLIANKESDQENLKSVIRRLLLIREAENIITISTSSKMNAEAGSLATFLAGYTLNPGIVETVKIGIIAAWAYVESVLDVRSLLAGDRIALVKSEAEFTSNLRNLATCLGKGQKAKSSKIGLCYKDHLRAILFATSLEKLTSHSFDLIESHIREDDVYSDFKVNNVIYTCQLDMKLEGDSLFLRFLNVKDKRDSYKYKRAGTMDFSK